MPLIIITGPPCAGKTEVSKRLAQGLREFLEANHKNNSEPTLFSPSTKITIIGDESWGNDRALAFSDSKEEKKARAMFISRIEKALGRRAVVIADNLNDIKGMRYQLYCQARALGTSSCTLYVETTKNKAAKVNETRRDAAPYPVDVFERLFARFEEPQYNNAWDAPLFFTSYTGEMNIAEIASATFLVKPLKVNKANIKAEAVLDSNYVLRIESAVNKIVMHIILELERNPNPPYLVYIPDSNAHVKFADIPSRTDLYMCKNKFTYICRSNKKTKISTIAESFAEFLNSYFE